jgi:hypothetical protein
VELAWPRLANEAIAIAIVVAKGVRKKIDRERTFRCMTSPPEKKYNRSIPGGTTAFQWF